MYSKWTAVFRALACTLAVTLTSSCATVDQVAAEHGTEIGCVAGGIAGAVGGYFVGQKLGNRAVGTAIGGVVGGGLGCYLGNRWQKRERALQDFARREKLELLTETLSVAAAPQFGAPVSSEGSSTGVAARTQRQSDSSKDNAGLVASIQSGGMFDTNSDQFTPDGMRQAKVLAQIYKPESPAQPGQLPELSALLVVGHTDATGPAAYNQMLSERRARTMGRVLAEAGIDPSRVYFQGAGSGRPIADNSTEQGRARNRRVEIVALDSSDLLVQRIRQEQASPKYLAHGTSTKPVGAQPVPPPAENQGQQIPAAPKSPPVTALVVPTPPGFVDFGGQPISSDSTNLAAYIKPRQVGFSLINTAYAAPVIAQDCHFDNPRVVGGVKNLATDQPLDIHETRDYIDGMNGRAWAGLVNGNLVTMSPVAVLRDGATVAKNPDTFVTRAYSKGKRNHSNALPSVANTYEGEDAILYRVFLQPDNAPLECFDVVLPKDGSGTAQVGKLYYNHGDATYVAPFSPQRS